MEQWLDVVDFEGIYEISNHGNVRSKITKTFKKITFAKTDGRPFLNLWKNNQQKIVRPHKLVLEAFVQSMILRIPETDPLTIESPD